jgi:predicted metal-dependent phosphoesterase TrpH
MRERVDLHVHSTYSDGIFSPEELVEMALRKNISAIALADHDSTDGVDTAMATGLRLGVEVIPAIELSVTHKQYKDIHLLGYYLDHHDPSLCAKLKDFRARRDQRGQAIISAINDKLIREKRAGITYEETFALAGGALGRPHIARILLQKGYARSMEDAFARYLIPCDVPKQYFAMTEALCMIRKLHGVAVLAHPTTISKDEKTLQTVISELVSLGLDGLEVVNNMSNVTESAFLKKLASDKKLLITGGSDFHGIESGIEIGSCWGEACIPYEYVESLRELHHSRRKIV